MGGSDVSDFSSKPRQVRAIANDLDERIKALTRWLSENSLQGSGQADLDDETTERLCWHYGYLIALRDVHELLVAA